MEDIGKKIHDRRNELKMSLEDVGKAVGVSKTTVLRWEKGDIKSMGLDKVPALAKVLQMDLGEFVPGFEMSSVGPIAVPFHPDVIAMVNDNINGRRLYATDAAPEPVDRDLEVLLKVWKLSSPKTRKAIIRVIKAMEEEEE